MKLLLPLCLSIIPVAPGLQADTVDDLIRRGRAELDAGRVERALELFQQADAETGGGLASRVWVLRTMFEQGERLNDAFDAVDALSRDHAGPALDYLYGIGSYFKARKLESQGVRDNSVPYAYMDTVSFLSKTVEADAQRFYDAWYPLADAAYRGAKYELASDAVLQAIERRPKDPTRHHLAGLAAFRLYQKLGPTDEQAAQAQLEKSIASLRTARDLAGTPDKQDAGAVVLVGDIQLDLGLALHFQGNMEQALECYSDSIGWNPGGFDYQKYWSSLGLEGFTTCLEAGARKYGERFGTEPVADATLLWWLGSAYCAAKRYQECEQTYLKVIQKWPAFANSWYYVGLSRYHRGEYEGAIQAWHENWKASPEDLVASLSGNAEFNTQILTWLIGECERRTRGDEEREGEPGYLLRATFLCEVRCAVQKGNWEFWDNWGLFAREGGAFLESRGKQQDREWSGKLYAQSLAAYEEALRLAPDKPHLYNDAAVILHYYLERDYERAMELYRQALAMATEQLAGEGLSEEERDLVQTAKRDSKTNIARLERKLEGGKGGDEEGEGEGGEGAGEGGKGD